MQFFMDVSLLVRVTEKVRKFFGDSFFTELLSKSTIGVEENWLEIFVTGRSLRRLLSRWILQNFAGTELATYSRGSRKEAVIPFISRIGTCPIL